jgi:uncharacterized protein YdbL (DUF1318 family)
MKRVQLVAVMASIAAALLVGCLQTKSEVEVKPVDINLNITGRLELVITDARRQEEAITGSAPKRTVRPEDIGLPPAPTPTSKGTGSGAILTDDGSALPGVVLVADIYPVDPSSDRGAQLVRQMATRHPQIAAMLDSQLVGESHTGFLVSKGSLSANQQAVVDAENADRTELYKLEAAKKNTTVDQVALAYYIARLEHVNKGTWVERNNKATGTWEWFRWNR